jgi:hypothetical protein
MKWHVRQRAGAQALTELAMLMPLIALLLIGLLELGFLLHAHVQVTAAAREGARAASLYRSTRYAAFSDQQLNNLNNPPSCASGIDGWSLQQTIEQAIVRRALDGNSCPVATGAVEYSALGRLTPDQAPAGSAPAPPCPTADLSGWLVGVAPPFSPGSSEEMPQAGAEVTLTLCYPHRLVVAADLLRYYGEPIWISKSVVFQYQQ